METVCPKQAWQKARHWLAVILYLVHCGLGHASDDFALAFTGKSEDGKREFSWKLRPGCSAFVPQLGVIRDKGLALMGNPLSSTRLTVLLATEKTIEIVSLPIPDDGSRGSDLLLETDSRNYQFPRDYEMTSSCVIELVKKLHFYLQNDLGFTVDAIQDLRSNAYQLLTTKGAAEVLSQSLDKGVVARRGAYRIEIHNLFEPCGSAMITVKTLVEYKRRSERVWRPDSSKEIHDILQARLRPMLSSKVSK